MFQFDLVLWLTRFASLGLNVASVPGASGTMYFYEAERGVGGRPFASPNTRLARPSKQFGRPPLHITRTHGTFTWGLLEKCIL